MDNTYGNMLRRYVNEPGSYSGSPGFQFALDTGLESARRKQAAGGMANSGNALAELTQLATGYAQQDYGNTIDRLGRLSGQEQQYGLGQEQNANTATRNANDFSLGQTQNALKGQNDFWNYDLGLGQNANQASRNQNDFSLGMGQNRIGMYNAQTNRGSAQSNDYYRGQDNARLWDQFYRGR